MLACSNSAICREETSVPASQELSNKLTSGLKALQVLQKLLAQSAKSGGVFPPFKRWALGPKNLRAPRLNFIAWPNCYLSPSEFFEIFNGIFHISPFSLNFSCPELAAFLNKPGLGIHGPLSGSAQPWSSFELLFQQRSGKSQALRIVLIAPDTGQALNATVEARPAFSTTLLPNLRT